MGSQKGQEIKQNPKVSLLFPWHQFERQVRIKGTAEKLLTADVETYFYSRPKLSQQAAICSNQSQVIESRRALEQKFKSLEQEKQLCLPERWGGYSVKPESYEFWQGGENRLHDRFRYERNNNEWVISRLQP